MKLSVGTEDQNKPNNDDGGQQSEPNAQESRTPEQPSDTLPPANIPDAINNPQLTTTNPIDQVSSRTTPVSSTQPPNVSYTLDAQIPTDVSKTTPESSPPNFDTPSTSFEKSKVQLNLPPIPTLSGSNESLPTLEAEEELSIEWIESIINESKLDDIVSVSSSSVSLTHLPNTTDDVSKTTRELSPPHFDPPTTSFERSIDQLNISPISTLSGSTESLPPLEYYRNDFWSDEQSKEELSIEWIESIINEPGVDNTIPSPSMPPSPPFAYDQIDFDKVLNLATAALGMFQENPEDSQCQKCFPDDLLDSAALVERRPISGRGFNDSEYEVADSMNYSDNTASDSRPLGGHHTGAIPKTRSALSLTDPNERNREVDSGFLSATISPNPYTLFYNTPDKPIYPISIVQMKAELARFDMSNIDSIKRSTASNSKPPVGWNTGRTPTDDEVQEARYYAHQMATEDWIVHRTERRLLYERRKARLRKLKEQTEKMKDDLPADLMYLGTLNTDSVVAGSKKAEIETEEWKEFKIERVEACGMGPEREQRHEMASEWVVTHEIVSEPVRMHEIASGMVEMKEMASGTVGTHEMASGTTETHEMTFGTVDTHEMASGRVETHEMTSGMVETHEMAFGTVETHEMASGIVGTHEMVSGRVKMHEIASEMVVTHEMASGRVNTPEMATAEAISVKMVPEGTKTDKETMDKMAPVITKVKKMVADKPEIDQMESLKSINDEMTPARPEIDKTELLDNLDHKTVPKTSGMDKLVPLKVKKPKVVLDRIKQPKMVPLRVKNPKMMTVRSKTTERKSLKYKNNKMANVNVVKIEALKTLNDKMVRQAREMPKMEPPSPKKTKMTTVTPEMGIIESIRFKSEKMASVIPELVEIKTQRSERGKMSVSKWGMNELTTSRPEMDKMTALSSKMKKNIPSGSKMDAMEAESVMTEEPEVITVQPKSIMTEKAKPFKTNVALKALGVKNFPVDECETLFSATDSPERWETSRITDEAAAFSRAVSTSALIAAPTEGESLMGCFGSFWHTLSKGIRRSLFSKFGVIDYGTLGGRACC